MRRLLVLLVAVAAAVALAGVFLPSNAATVGGTTISRQSLNSDLSAISRSADYRCFLAAERVVAGEKAAPLLGAGTSTPTLAGVFGTQFTGDWLGSLVTEQVTATLVARHGITITRADVALGRSILARRITGVLAEYAQTAGTGSPGCGGSGSAVLASVPGWFVTEQATAEANQAALDARAVGAGLGGSALAAYYAAHRSSFDRYCVSVIVVKTTTDAATVKAALDSGTSFADEALTSSITSDSAVRGGQLGCGLIAGTFLAPKLDDAPLNAVIGPFTADGVWWLAVVTSRTAQPLSSVQSAVVTAILEAGQTRADAEVKAALKTADVNVDPRYGQATSNPVTLIIPPPSPPPGTVPSLAANAPPAAATSA